MTTNSNNSNIWKLCIKFDHSILRKIIKLVATRCQILRVKCTKIDFGSAPDPAGELTALPRSLAEFKGAFLRAGGGGGKWEG